MGKDTKLRLLVLRGRSSKSEAFIEFLAREHEVVLVESFAQALGLIRAQEFDAVISETADFLPLERSSGIQQATTILNTLAVAYAAEGRFKMAIETAQKALELAQSSSQKQLTENIQKHLLLFRQDKPYIEENRVIPNNK